MTEKGPKLGKQIYKRYEMFESLLLNLGIDPVTAHEDAGTYVIEIPGTMKDAGEITVIYAYESASM